MQQTSLQTPILLKWPLSMVLCATVTLLNYALNFLVGQNELKTKKNKKHNNRA